MSLFGDDDAQDVLVVNHTDDGVAVDHAARALVVQDDAGGVTDDLVAGKSRARRDLYPT